MIFDRHAKLALIVASLTLAVCGIGFRYAVHAANAILQKKPVPLREQLTSIPKRLGPWVAEGPDMRMTAEIEETLGTRWYVDRQYVREGSGRSKSALGMHIAYYTGLIDAVPHVPDRCLTIGGWLRSTLAENIDLPVDRSGWRWDPKDANPGTDEPYPLLTFRHHITGRPITVHMPKGAKEHFKLRIQEFRIPSRPDARIYAGYFFIANGRITPSPDKVRTLAFRLTEKYAYYAKVQLTMYARSDVGRDEYVELVSDFLAELLPELMRCLPDWPEVESRQHAPSAEPAE